MDPARREEMEKRLLARSGADAVASRREGDSFVVSLADGFSEVILAPGRPSDWPLHLLDERIEARERRTLAAMGAEEAT